MLLPVLTKIQLLETICLSNQEKKVKKKKKACSKCVVQSEEKKKKVVIVKALVRATDPVRDNVSDILADKADGC